MDDASEDASEDLGSYVDEQSEQSSDNGMEEELGADYNTPSTSVAHNEESQGWLVVELEDIADLQVGGPSDTLHHWHRCIALLQGLRQI
jgi:hypothetical protein